MAERCDDVDQSGVVISSVQEQLRQQRHVDKIAWSSTSFSANNPPSQLHDKALDG